MQEAPTFAKVSKKYADKDVQFLGIDVRDDPSSGQALQPQVRHHLSEHRRLLQPNGLGFAKSLPAQAIPTTWIIDSKGRVAVRIMVEGLTADTLSGLIDDVQKSTA